MATTCDVDLTGLWTFAQDPVKDDYSAAVNGVPGDDGEAGLHGTWTRPRYFVIRTEDDQPGDNAVAILFDEDGNFAKFVWSPGSGGFDTWTLKPDPITFTSTALSLPDQPEVPAATRTVYPTLSLAQNEKKDCPVCPLTHGGKTQECLSGCQYGNVYVKSVGDQSSQQQLPEQSLTWKPDDDAFYWSSGALQLKVYKPGPQMPLTDPKANNFDETFTGQSHLAQIELPFYGFDPRGMHLYSADDYYSTPGTSGEPPPYALNTGQELSHPLLFHFPAPDSKEYVRYYDPGNQPNLPIGHTSVVISSGSDLEQSAMMSTVSDRMNSWSTTLGLSAGVPGLLNASAKTTYSDKIETQKQTESRFTVARKLEESWAVIAHIPSLQLENGGEDGMGKGSFVSAVKERAHDQFRYAEKLAQRNELAARVAALAKRGAGGGDRAVQALELQLTKADEDLQAASPDWADFVEMYGTHYLHSMTQGKLQYSETTFSLQAEMNAHTQGVDLETESKVTLDGAFDVGGSSKLATEWSTKLSTTFTEEQAQAFRVGYDALTPDGVAILFDLRPITELFSPVFIPYNPADDWQQLAPWVWSDVRSSFAAYLTGLGLNQPITDTSMFEDYTPRLVKVTFPWVTVDKEETGGFGPYARDVEICGWGSIKLELAQDASDAEAFLESTDYQLNGVQLNGDGQKPGDTDFSCVVAVRGGTSPKLTLDFSDLKLADAGLQSDPDTDFSGTQVTSARVLPARADVTPADIVSLASELVTVPDYSGKITITADLEETAKSQGGFISLVATAYHDSSDTYPLIVLVRWELLGTVGPGQPLFGSALKQATV
jgi:MAC/Perforin domain